MGECYFWYENSEPYAKLGMVGWYYGINGFENQGPFATWADVLKDWNKGTRL